MAAPVTISESTAGPNFAASSAESVLVVVGCAAGGDEDSPSVARNDRQPAETFTAGPLVEFGSIIVGEGRQPAVLVRAAAASPGAYGSLDDDDFTGTAVPGVDAGTVPYNAYEAYVEFVAGGNLGTSGVTYRTSLDGGLTLSGLKALGTATSITIAEGNVEFTLSVPEDELVDLVADIRVQVLAHFAEGATVHNAADATSGVGIGGVPATEAAAIARINEIRAALLLHAANTPTVHNSADATSFASLPAAATDGPTAVALANAIALAYQVHLENVTVHDTEDVTNLITETAATTGTIVAGDILRVLTTAPLFDATTLADALATLPNYQGHVFGGLCVAGPITSSQMWTSVINALDLLEEQQRSCCALLETRLPNDGESAATYRTAMETLFDSLRDNRVGTKSGDGRYYPTEVRQASQQFRRSGLAMLAARHVALRYEQSHALVDPISRSLSASPSTFGGPLRGFRIYDDDAQPCGHDEVVNPGLSDLLFITTTTYPQEGGAAFVTEPKTRAPDNDTVYVLPIRRIANVAKRLIYFRLTRLVQSLLLRELGTTQMSEAAANNINKLVLADLRRELTGRVTGVTFEVDVPGSDISVTSPRVLWNASVTTGAYVAGFDGTLSINR